jgi:hypothetical protein
MAQSEEGAIMSENSGQFHVFLAPYVRAAIGVAVLIALAGCDKYRDIPRPPRSPPKPVTQGDAYIPAAQTALGKSMAWSMH